MALTSLTEMPQSFESGDTVRVTLGYSEYPATLWTAALKLNLPGTTPTSVNGTASGTNFIFVLSAVTTAAMAAGVYDYAVRVTETSSGEITTAEEGFVVVEPNVGALIAKSTAQLQLEAAYTAFSTLVANPFTSVSFNGQSFSKDNQGSLLDLISRLEAKVASERNPGTRCIRPVFT